MRDGQSHLHTRVCMRRGLAPLGAGIELQKSCRYSSRLNACSALVRVTAELNLIVSHHSPSDRGGASMLVTEGLAGK
jgi:hypothetical protein